MYIVIAAQSKDEYIRQIALDETAHTYTWVNHAKQFSDYEKADAFIDFNDESYDYRFVKKPLIINQTSKTLIQIQCNQRNTARFCGWTGFADRPAWEIAAESTADSPNWEPIIAAVGKEMILVRDIVGLIAPRILCAIINEACYTINEGISDAAQIDIAMKLGTNYPDGPIHWGKAIGARRIIDLLDAMASEDERYIPHESLIKILA